MFRLLIGVFLPFFGTTLGAFFVFFFRDKFVSKLNKIMLGFAAGVMIASSIWSLILPALNRSEIKENLAFLPVVCGICLGLFFMLLLDNFCLKLSNNIGKKDSIFRSKTALLCWAVTIHNIPEGMAVGVIFASAYFCFGEITFAAALAFSTGIAIQNIPEGAIVSMPLKTENFSRKKAFSFGVISGIVEPLFAILTIFLIRVVNPILPYLVAFAAGAMIYVSVDELIPESHEDKNSKIATISFVVGFLIMMTLDVALG